jgi:hypothetical protein
MNLRKEQILFTETSFVHFFISVENIENIDITQNM